ncbi:MAG: hypothetical protein VW405_22255 [Rhodospirillaceae bacterium]
MIWVPNGYANGVGPVPPDRLPTFADRQLSVFFAGNVTGIEGDFPERAALFETVRAHGLPSAMGATPSFGAGMGRVSYATHLANAKFAPVPAGMSPETIRLYDALENGAIPLALDHPYLNAPDALGAFGGVPFPVLQSWDQLPALLAPVLAGDAAAIADWEHRRREIGGWWANLKHRVEETVAVTVEDAFAQSPT